MPCRSVAACSRGGSFKGWHPEQWFRAEATAAHTLPLNPARHRGEVLGDVSRVERAIFPNDKQIFMGASTNPDPPRL